jgi:hypothetical protein
MNAITHDHRWTMDAAHVEIDERGTKKAHWNCCGEWARGLWAEQPEAIAAYDAMVNSPEFKANMARIRLEGAKASIKRKFSRLDTTCLIGRFVGRTV